MLMNRIFAAGLAAIALLASANTANAEQILKPCGGLGIAHTKAQALDAAWDAYHSEMMHHFDTLEQDWDSVFLIDFGFTFSPAIQRPDGKWEAHYGGWGLFDVSNGPGGGGGNPPGGPGGGGPG